MPTTKIEITEFQPGGVLKRITIEGNITTSPNITMLELSAMLFQMEWTLNEYAPKMRVHIGLNRDETNEVK